MLFENFNEGVVVRLKVSDTDMVVDKIVTPTAAFYTGIKVGIHCVWHDQLGDAIRDVYSPKIIYKVED